MSSLVLIEHDNQKVTSASLSVMTAALNFSKTLDVWGVGFACQSVIDTLQQASCVSRVLWWETSEYVSPRQAVHALHEFRNDYDTFMAPANAFGKDIMPRLAASLDVSQISDITAIISKDTFVRPIYAGNAFLTVQVLDSIKVLTIRPSAFHPIVLEKGGTAELQKVLPSVKPDGVRFVERKQHLSERPELSSAKIVVSGGRGLKSKENFALIEQLASELNAAIGASRAAVDEGFVPNDYQVGQTGKVVAPDLYIAIGISGAIQHLAGMKDSKVIVAINQDPNAPIFQVADYGMVGDLFEIVPALCRALKR